MTTEHDLNTGIETPILTIDLASFEYLKKIEDIARVTFAGCDETILQ